MQNSWLQTLDSVLRPARPELARCLAERERHLTARNQVTAERARALANCERRIEEARTVVFDAGDGFVSADMTTLEREWRQLARRDPEEGLMDLWARLVPPSSIDRKRWRDTDPADQLQAAIALAADAQNVELAEAAILKLRQALAAHGTPVGERIRWAWFERDSECLSALLAEPLLAAREACPADLRMAIFERAERLSVRLHDAALLRFPGRPGLANDFAHAALVDFVWRAAELGEAGNPVTPLRTLWGAGYVLSAASATSVTLEIPALSV